jgi:hypothetical protein
MGARLGNEPLFTVFMEVVSEDTAEGGVVPSDADVQAVNRAPIKMTKSRFLRQPNKTGC